MQIFVGFDCFGGNDFLVVVVSSALFGSWGFLGCFYDLWGFGVYFSGVGVVLERAFCICFGWSVVFSFC